MGRPWTVTADRAESSCRECSGLRHSSPPGMNPGGPKAGGPSSCTRLPPPPPPGGCVLPSGSPEPPCGVRQGLAQSERPRLAQNPSAQPVLSCTRLQGCIHPSTTTMESWPCTPPSSARFLNHGQLLSSFVAYFSRWFFREKEVGSD